jgi:hypothetical protein
VIFSSIHGYISAVELRRIKWTVLAARVRKKRNAFRLLVKKLEEWRPFRTSGRRWNGTIK